MADVVMPRLSDTMEQGTVAKWLKKEGEAVTKGEPLVEIETDKANMVLDAYESGVLERIVVGEGQMVPLGETIAHIGAARAAGAAPDAGTEASQAGAPATPRREPAETPPAPRPAEAPPPQLPPSDKVAAEETEEVARLKASPIARRIAQEHDLDLSAIRGTGPAGRIIKEDVERAVQKGGKAVPAAAAMPGSAVSAPAEPAVSAGANVPLSRMQATIARRMVESKTSAPHFYVTADIDVGATQELRDALNALPEATNTALKVGINDIIVKAAALALRKFPDVNASFAEGSITFHDEVNVGIAVAVPRGLVVPVLRQADQKSLRVIARETRDLIERTRSNRLAPAEWEGGTFTVSNLGMYDVDEFIAIITPPQSGILAVGSIRPTPSAVEGQIKILPRMKVTLSADHRVYYGATAAEFLQEVRHLLEHPLSLLL